MSNLAMSAGTGPTGRATPARPSAAALILETSALPRLSLTSWHSVVHFTTTVPTGITTGRLPAVRA